MRRCFAVVLAVSSSVSVLAGCAADATNDPTVSESELRASAQRLDRVTVAEIVAVDQEHMKTSLDACKARHPDIQRVTTGNLSRFTQSNGEHTSFHFRVERLLRELDQDSIAVSGILSKLEARSERVLGPMAGAGGILDYDAASRVRANQEELFDHHYAYSVAAERKALDRARNPRGVDLREIREQWRVLERATNLDSAWLNPVKMSGDPSTVDVKKALQIDYEASQSSWGTQAVEDFHQAGEGPEGSAAFEPIKTALGAASIKKRWYFSGGGERRGGAWSRNYLAVLDEHNQLWGFMMGYSE